MEKTARKSFEFEKFRRYFSDDFLNEIIIEFDSGNIDSFPYESVDDKYHAYYCIRPLSGKLNVNFLPDYLKEYLHSVNLLCDEKNITGFISDYKQLGDCDVENLDDYYTFYSFFNLNLIDEDDLRFVSKNIGLELNENLYRQKKSIGKNRIAYKTYSQLKMDSGTASFNLKNTFFNLEPVIDVNHADKKLLAALLSCPLFGIYNPESKASAICQERTIKRITTERLRQILKENDDALILGLLGTKTYFYEILMSACDMNCSAVICCENNFYENNPKLTYRVLEVRFEKQSIKK